MATKPANGSRKPSIKAETLIVGSKPTLKRSQLSTPKEKFTESIPDLEQASITRTTH
ncbi:MAG: hypothetical protein BWY82_02235 [Verrucomicrobia bacterium ADurb.Bin474]|nr:MAG: hypothetical protein BWY82_02235 [Verrucomicrobia bacterium ADurb.Bin474]